MQRCPSPVRALLLLLLTAACLAMTSCGYVADFSPDGSKVAFQEPVKDHYAIAVANVDGTGYRVIARSNTPDMPVWSPDGRAILYLNDGYLCVYDLTQRRTRQLAKAPNCTAHVWSAEGRQIAWMSSEKSQAVWLDAATGEVLLRVEVAKPAGSLSAGYTFASLPATWGIAYIGKDGNVHIVEAGRSSQITKTGDVVSLWVSRDGSRLRWVRSVRANKPLLVLHEYDLASRSIVEPPRRISLSHITAPKGYRLAGCMGVLSQDAQKLLAVISFQKPDAKRQKPSADAPRIDLDLYTHVLVTDLNRPRLLTLWKGRGIVTALRWSPNSRLLALTIFGEKDNGLWIARADGSQKRLIRPIGQR